MSFKGVTPILETDRLLLRSYCKEDLQDLYEYLSDETVVLKENNKMIGNVYLGKREFETLELGYDYRRRDFFLSRMKGEEPQVVSAIRF